MLKKLALMNLVLAFNCADNAYYFDVNRPISSALIRDSRNDKYYSRLDSLECGSAHVTVVSSCYVSRRGEVPFCYSQTISLIDIEHYKSSTLSYSHEMKNGTPEFIGEISCVKIGPKRVLSLEGTNFGNCSTCEWEDVFELDGVYIGSTGDPIHDRPVRFKQLEKSQSDALYADSNVLESSIIIDRNP